MKHANRAGITFLVPAILIIAFVLLFPIIQTVVLSFGRNSTSIFTGYEYSGLANYQRLLKTPRFITSLNNTIFFTAVTVPIELALGIALALILNRRFYGKGLVRMAVLFPWALPTALNALMWRWMFNTEFGLFNSLLTDTGLALERVNWLGAIPTSMYAMMFVSIWKTSSFMALLLLAGLQTIPDDLYEAGSVDGTSRLTELRFITLPLLRPAILVSVLLRTMDAMRTFELPFNLTDGGPLTSTETLSLYAYRAIFQYVNFNLGSSAILIQFIIIMSISIMYIMIIRRGDA
ncbi:MAG: sugar ABC transporter permease [Chloroflexi bacterium]|nr:sugar ABC transporter permease [Chloroflexota bacterium]